MIKRLTKWLEDLSYFPCEGYQCNHYLDPLEFDCRYKNSGEITCDNCLCNDGIYNPDTGKKDHIRYFFINYEYWLKTLLSRILYRLRGKCCGNCKHHVYSKETWKIIHCGLQCNKTKDVWDFCKKWEKKEDHD